MSIVEVAKGSEDSAMAGMLGNLIEQNIAQSPVKERIFRAMRTVVVLHIEDIDLALTMEFRYGGHLVLYDGAVLPPKITIRTESAYVMELSGVSIRFGLPYLFDEKGKEILKVMLAGKLKMSVMPWNILDVIRLTRVMSFQD